MNRHMHDVALDIAALRIYLRETLKHHAQLEVRGEVGCYAVMDPRFAGHRLQLTATVRIPGGSWHRVEGLYDPHEDIMTAIDPFVEDCVKACWDAVTIS